MPLHVEIRINERVIETINIGRLTSLKGGDYEHPYAVWRGSPELTTAGLADAVKFTHRYDDGAEVCVIKALQALNKEDGD